MDDNTDGKQAPEPNARMTPSPKLEGDTEAEFIPPAYIQAAHDAKQSWARSTAESVVIGSIGGFVILVALVSCVAIAIAHAGASSPTQTNGNAKGLVAYTGPTATPKPTATPNPTATPRPTATTIPTAVPTQSPSQYRDQATSVSVADISKDPNSYLGESVTFQGQIVGFVHDSSGNVAGVNVSDPNNFGAVIQVEFSPFVTVANMNQNDTITVWGQGAGSFTGTNAFGGTITEGAVYELYLHDSASGYNDNNITDPQAYANSLP